MIPSAPHAGISVHRGWCAPFAFAILLLGTAAAADSGRAPVDGLPAFSSSQTTMMKRVRTTSIQSVFERGDVFVGIANGLYQHYDNAGNLLETLDTGLDGFTTGGAFNSTGDLYTTALSADRVVVFAVADPHLVLQTLDVTAHGGLSPEDVVFDASGNFYVTCVGGNGNIQRFDASGTWQQNYGTTRTDWIDLASDQTTMFYTIESGEIRRWNLGTNTAMSNFADIGGVTFAFRLLAPGDGSGGLIAAHQTDIVRLDGGGAVVQTYDAPGENAWFSLNLDPNGTSFWAADFQTANFYRFNIATGAIELGPINTGTGGNTVFGIIVNGEITAGVCFHNDITPTFTAPTPDCGSTIDAHAGAPVSFTVAGHDTDTVNGSPVNVTLDAPAGDVPPGATMTPAVPTSGNPVSSTFNWTPGVADAGDHLIRFTLEDGCSEAVQCSVTVHVTTNRPPDCRTAVASEPVLWPPDHKYHAVSILGVTDPDGDHVSITVTSITQDEPINTRGDGTACPDGLIENGQASVRAERTGTPSIPGNGRVYVVNFTADDGNGGTCNGSVSVCVPHDTNTPTCVDDGQRYASTGSCQGGNSQEQEVTAYGLDLSGVTSNEVMIQFAIPKDSQVQIAVYDVAGRRLAMLENGTLAMGTYQRTWNMNGVAKGLYFVRMSAAGTTMSKTLLKLH